MWQIKVYFYISNNERFSPKISHVILFCSFQVHLGWHSGCLWHLFERLQQKQGQNEAPLIQGYQEPAADTKESPISFTRCVEAPSLLPPNKYGEILHTQTARVCSRCSVGPRFTGRCAEICAWATGLHHHRYWAKDGYYRVWPPISLTNSWCD